MTSPDHGKEHNLTDSSQCTNSSPSEHQPRRNYNRSDVPKRAAEVGEQEAYEKISNPIIEVVKMELQQSHDTTDFPPVPQPCPGIFEEHMSWKGLNGYIIY